MPFARPSFILPRARLKDNTMQDPSAAAGAAATDPPAAVTPFPAPPPFFRLYARGAAAGPAPPPPPARAAAPLSVFGAEHRAVEAPEVPPLQVPDLLRQAGVQENAAGAGTGPQAQNNDPRPALHLLLDALLAAALRLLDTLVESPGSYAAQATAVIAALHNLMHRINSLRPGQTREALIAALEAQVREKRAAAAAVRAAARAAGEELARRAAEVEAAAAASGGGGDGGGDAMEVEVGAGAGGGGSAKKASKAGGQQQQPPQKQAAKTGRRGGGGGG